MENKRSKIIIVIYRLITVPHLQLSHSTLIFSLLIFNVCLLNSNIPIALFNRSRVLPWKFFASCDDKLTNQLQSNFWIFLSIFGMFVNFVTKFFLDFDNFQNIINKSGCYSMSIFCTLWSGLKLLMYFHVEIYSISAFIVHELHEIKL